MWACRKWVIIMAFDKSAFGKRLCACREKENLSRAEFAKRINVTENYIFSLEAGRKTPSLPLYIDIVNALHLKPDCLICDSIDAPSNSNLEEIDEKLKKLSGHTLKTVNAVIDTLIEQLENKS